MLFVNTFVVTLTFTGCVSNMCWVAGITALYVTVLEEGLSPSVVVHNRCFSLQKLCDRPFILMKGLCFLYRWVKIHLTTLRTGRSDTKPLTNCDELASSDDSLRR